MFAWIEQRYWILLRLFAPVLAGVVLSSLLHISEAEVVGTNGGGSCNYERFGHLECNPLPANYYSGALCQNSGRPVSPTEACFDSQTAGAKCVNGHCDCSNYNDKMVCGHCNVLSQMELDGRVSGQRPYMLDTTKSVDLCDLQWGGGSCTSDADCSIINGGLCIGGQCFCYPGYGCARCDKTEIEFRYGLKCDEAKSGEPMLFGRNSGMQCCDGDDCNRRGTCTGGTGAKYKSCICGIGWACADCSMNLTMAIKGAYKCNSNLKPKQCLVTPTTTPVEVQNSAADGNEQKSQSIPGWLVGAIVGSVVGLTLMVGCLLWFFCYRPRHNAFAYSEIDDDDDDRFI